jgi:hypothetical protein
MAVLIKKIELAYYEEFARLQAPPLLAYESPVLYNAFNSHWCCKENNKSHETNKGNMHGHCALT